MHGNGLCVTIKYSKGWERVALMINENNNSMLRGANDQERKSFNRGNDPSLVGGADERPMTGLVRTLHLSIDIYLHEPKLVHWSRFVMTTYSNY